MDKPSTSETAEFNLSTLEGQKEKGSQSSAEFSQDVGIWIEYSTIKIPIRCEPWLSQLSGEVETRSEWDHLRMFNLVVR